MSSFNYIALILTTCHKSFSLPSKLMKDENLHKAQVYNADETGDVWRKLPSSLLCLEKQLVGIVILIVNNIAI